MIPVFAIVGRPNVGKSTLFNCLTRTRQALVSNYSGLTRDRQYGHANINGHQFVVIDTGGIEGEERGIDHEMLKQTRAAIEEANVILFMVDAKAGVTAADEMLAEMLRRQSKPVRLVLNKIDGQNPDIVTGEFYALGLGDPYPIAAAHRRGTNQLLEFMMENLPDIEGENANSEIELRGIKLAIVGKPNVGKSTLVNRMLGEERVVVYDQPGTTRDSVFIPLKRRDKEYTLIDTAGVRRKRSVKETIEKFSIIKTLKAIDTANVVIMIIDAQENISEQDLHLLGYIVESGRSLLLAVNKWDGMDEYSRDNVKSEIDRRLTFVDYAKIHYISALHGTGVGNLFDTAETAYKSAMAKHSTNTLTKILEAAVVKHPPPIVNGRRIKLRYAHPGGHNPPIVVIHGNQTKKISKEYTRYLINTYRKTLKLVGTPIRIEFKTSENPFKDKKNVLTPTQVRKRKRLIKRVKKKS